MRAAGPWVVLLLCLWAAWAGADPPEAGKPRKVILAVLNQVTWHDLLGEGVNAPVLRRLVREGAVGVMCVRTARGSGTEGAYVTIGAGTRVAVHARDEERATLEGQAYDRGELVDGVPAGQLHQARTGWPVGDNSIVHLGIGELIRENAAASYPVHLGLLGGALRRAGLRVACVGNADTPQSVHRELVGIGMDEQGLVPLGRVGRGLLRWQTDLPYLYTTDPTRMAADIARALAEADLVVIELGETARAGESAELTTASAAESVRSRAIERSDRMLAQVVSAAEGWEASRGEPNAERGWMLLVVTPSVRAPAPSEQFSALAPVIMFGPGVRGGLLASPSTRRAGVVVNTDIAATVLAYFDLPRPPDTVGRAIVSEETRSDHVEWLTQQVGRQDVVEASRRPVFRWLSAHIAVAMWLAAFLLLLGQRAPRWARAMARGLLLMAMAGPAAGLLAAPLALSAPRMVAAIIGGAAALALVSCWLTAWRSADAVPAVLVVGALVYDLIFGRTMLEWSPLSYSVAAGARFYGIGNEYAGVLLGAALVSGASLLPSRSKSWWGERFVAALMLIGLVVMVGHPRLGADYGMAFGCAVGFAVFALYLWREQPAWRDAALVFWIAFGLVGALVLVDVFMRGTPASHVGLLATQVRDIGWQPIWQAAARKLSMNWLLVRTSPWTDAAAASAGLLAVVLAARPQAVLEALDEREWLRPAVLACVVGAVASFALNDSGVVAAALALLYGAGSLAYLGLAEPARV